jgi:hypothetical protein
MVKRRRKRDSLETDIREIIQYHEQCRHFMEFPKSATKLMKNLYTLNSAKYIIGK